MMNEGQIGTENVIWESIKEVIGEVVYGGRVTDEIDRRTLKTILSKFITPEIFTDGYYYLNSIYRPLGKDSTEISSLKSEILSFPDKDEAEIFGMTSIADLNF
jgi:dynein heavy chain